MVKEINSKNGIIALIISSIIVDVLFGFTGIYLLLAGYFFAGLGLIIFISIITIIFVCVIICLLNKDKKEKEIMEKGYKVNGTVVSIGHKRIKRRDAADYHTYMLNIKYTDKDGSEHIFTSRKLGFKPKEGYNITCDVYIHNGKEYPTNFVNLYKGKSEKDVLILVFVLIVIIFGYAYISNTFF